MNLKIKDAVMAAFIADALALGVHWVYDTADIDKKYGRLQTMVDPELVPYHQPKQKGDFTHYGDQMMVLMESIQEISIFDLTHFSRAWQKMFQSYTGYMDHATQETLRNFKAGTPPEQSGSLSMDLGGAARIAPLILVYGEDINAFVDAAICQTAMTHKQVQVTESAEFFARTATMTVKGIAPSKAIEKALKQMPNATGLHQMVKAGVDRGKEDTRQVISRFGQICSVQAALPSTLHLIVKYEDNLTAALIENIMAGGDSSARGMLAGFILGSYQGLGNIPNQWLADMKAREKIIGLLSLDKSR